MPPTQVAVPLVELHTFVQRPHFAGSPLRFVSQPFVTFASQLPYPMSHAIPQAPAVQLATPWLELHTVVQVLQWAGSVLRLTSQPLEARLSQLP
jgi:hypothetical protein